MKTEGSVWRSFNLRGPKLYTHPHRSSVVNIRIWIRRESFERQPCIIPTFEALFDPT